MEGWSNAGRAHWSARLFEADHLYLDHVGHRTFYGFLASMRGQLFQDEEFAILPLPPVWVASAVIGQVASRLLITFFTSLLNESLFRYLAYNGKAEHSSRNVQPFVNNLPPTSISPSQS